MIFLRCTMLAFAFSTVLALPVQGQLYRVETGTQRTGSSSTTDASKTNVRVELLTGKEGVGLAAQQWRQTFEQIGFTVRIRQAILDDKPEIKEQKVGRLRNIVAIGRMERDGKLVFPDRTFSRGDGRKLQEWLRSLQTFGAQGSPEGQPLWGLDKQQFSEFYNALSSPVETELHGKMLPQAVVAMKLPEKYPVRFTTTAGEMLKQPELLTRHVSKNVEGHSRGTALSLLLHDYGLGFRPLRTPEGAIELAVESLKTTDQLWPIGWDLKQTRAKTAPGLFQFVPVDLNEVKLLDVFAAIEATTKVPIHIDYHSLEKERVDIDEIVVSYPSKRTSWSLLLNGITVPNKLKRKLRIDEQGKPFVWVTPLTVSRSR